MTETEALLYMSIYCETHKIILFNNFHFHCFLGYMKLGGKIFILLRIKDREGVSINVISIKQRS